MLVSVCPLLPCHPSCFPTGLVKANGRIMMPLLSAPPLRGLCRCHGWPALEEEEEKEEGQNRGFLISSQMTSPASLNVLEKSTLTLFSSQRD